MAVQTLCLSSQACDTTATRFAPIMGSGNGTVESINQSPIPSAGKFKQLRIWSAAAPGAGNSYTVTLRLGGASQSLTATISDANVYAEDVTHEVSCAIGDLVCWTLVPASGPTDEVMIMISAIYEAVGNDYLIILGGGAGTAFTGGDLVLENIWGGGKARSNYDTSQDQSEQAKIPIGGTVRQFALYTNCTADTGGGSATGRIYKEAGGELSSDIVVTNGTGAFVQNVTGLSIAVTAGQRLTVAMSLSGSGMSYTARFHYGIAYEPSDLTKAFFVANFAADNGAVNWIQYGETGSSQASEYLWPFPACTIGDFGIDIGSAPGTGNTWDYVSRTGADIGSVANGNVALQITGNAATSDTDTGDDSVAAGSLWGIQVTPTSTPSNPTNGHRINGIITWPSSGTTATIVSALDEISGALAANQSYLTTVDSDLDELTASLNVAMHPLITIASAVDELIASLNAQQQYLATVASSLDELTASLNLEQSYLVTIDSDVDELTASLEVAMHPQVTIAALVDEAIASLNVDQSTPITLTIASTVDEVTASLNAQQIDLVTIASLVDEVVASLNANQVDLVTIGSTLDEVTSSLSLEQRILMTIASVLDETTASLNAEQRLLVTIGAVIDELGASLTLEQMVLLTVAASLDEATAALFLEAETGELTPIVGLILRALDPDHRLFPLAGYDGSETLRALDPNQALSPLEAIDG